MHYILAADVGTSSVKVVLFDTEGNTIGLAKRSYGISRPAPGQAEQDPEEYVHAAFTCLRELMDNYPETRAGLLGFAADGQTSTEIYLDKEGNVLRPAIIWQDMRAGEQAKRLSAAFPKERRLNVFGFNAPMGAGSTPARLMWLRDNQPTLAERLCAVMQPKDFVNFRLTGVRRSDFWSAKSLADIRTCSVSEELMHEVGFPVSVISPLGRPWDEVGRVSAEAAAATGLPEGLPVICGFSDSIGTMMGSGAFSGIGIGFNSTGTSEIVGATVDSDYPAGKLLAMPRAVMSVAAVQYGTTQSGGSALLWLNQQITHAADYAAAVAAASMTAPGADGLVFLPYLNGERAPLWDASATGAFLGLSAAHNSGHMTRAVMEGVAMSLRHCFDELRINTGVTPRQVNVIGGASRVSLWNQIRADVTGIPYVTLQSEESGALGVAMLVGLAAGVWRDIPEASAKLIRETERFEPNAALAPMYDELYDRYRFAYEAQLMYRARQAEKAAAKA